MRKKHLSHPLLQGVYHYLLFFLLVAFLVSCTMSLFVSTLSRDLGVMLTDENLNRAAKLTFLNVLMLSVLFTLIDLIRRKLTTEKVTRHIADATRELVRGNFDIRIAPVGKLVADDSINEIIDCFNQMAQELGSLETLRTDFIANVSHEMKTPLTVMLHYGTLLQKPGLSEEKRLEYARGIADGSRRLADMMTNILKLNRLENQQIYPQSSRFDLGEQLCQCLLQFETVWERSGIEIETDLADTVMVEADKELLALVWNNLLSNAFKFTPSGGRVWVTLTADATLATVQIRDTGCGMTAEVGSHIFEKFYQGDTSHATAGNGLGLALVKRVIDILQGEISVESAPGEGSVFTVTIRRDLP